jgi:hypothetical protein
MKENKKINVYSSTATFVIFSLILAGSIFGMVMFLKPIGENTKYEEEKPKTTTKVVETTKAVTTDDSPVSYVTTLKDVIIDKKFDNNYSLSIDYQNTNYYFKCTNYDEENKDCISGIALLQYNNNAIPLYVFNEPENDYARNNKDFYIIVEENYVVFTYDGITEVYTSKGEEHTIFKNVLTSFQGTDEMVLYKDKYPVLKDNNLEYYLCDTNTVFKRIYSLKDLSILNQEIVPEGIC